jgi:hypothetical protein
MGYYLLWLEQLVAALLWVAMIVAWSTHWPRDWARYLATTLAVLLPFTIYVLVAVGAGYLQYAVYVRTGLLIPAISLAALFLIGAVSIVAVGGRGGGKSKSASARWPAGRLALFGLLAVLLNFVTFWNLDAAVLQRLASLRAEASAVASAVAPIRVVDSENAAFLYDQAFESIKADTAWPDEWDEATWRTMVNDQPIDVLAAPLPELLERHKGTLRLLRQAAARPACYFDRDYTRPSIHMLLPELLELRRAAQLLLLNARYQAAQGNLQAAVHDIDTVLRISRHVSNEPFVAGLLVTMAVHNEAVQTLDDIVDGHELDEPALMALELTDTLPFRRLMNKALRLEEAFGLSIFCELDSREDFFTWASEIYGGTGPAIPGTAALYRVLLLSQDLGSYREKLQLLQSLTRNPYYEVADLWKETERERKRDPGGFLTALLLPALSRMGRATVESDGYQVVGRVAVALLRYRARQGSFPDDLSPLSPELLPFVPLDPATGKPLVYVKSETGFLLYSLGPDRVDDGGAPHSRIRTTGDIIFRYQREP